jgi:hypothetical protein
MTRLSWFTHRDGIDWPRVLLAALSCTVIVAVGVVGATSATAFGPYNPSWDGASDLREQVTTETAVEGEFVSETSRYQEVDPEGTVAFVIAPDNTYDPTESEHVRQFVENGGMLVVLENFGDSGNALLGDIGADARVDGDLLRDERNNFQAPTMPIATGVENHTLTSGVDQLTLNYATAVQPGNATVLVRTSEFAYLVENEDEELDDDDELAAYPVATVEDLGSGTVVVVGDPSITINAMLDQPDNTAFLRGLYTRGDRALFDISHNEGLPPLTTAVLTVRESALLQIVLGGLGIVGLALLSGRPVRHRIRQLFARHSVLRRFHVGLTDHREQPPIMSDDDRATYLRQQYPDWDEQRINRVIAALNRTDSKGRDDTDE